LNNFKNRTLYQLSIYSKKYKSEPKKTRDNSHVFYPNLSKSIIKVCHDYFFCRICLSAPLAVYNTKYTATWLLTRFEVTCCDGWMIVLVLLTAQCNPPWTCPFQAFIPGKLIAGEFHGFFLGEHYELWINADDKINLSNIWPWGLRVRPSSFNFFCWAKS